MTARTSAGTTLAISAGSPATFDSTGFAALTFTAIGEITDIGGEIGRSYNLVPHNPIGSRATIKKKGSYNSGSAQISLALDRDDAGQVIARTALSSDAEYAFKLTEQDGSVVYFKGIVLSFPVNYGGVDNITTATLAVEITANATGQDFVIVDAS